jgi:uncharacterized membrane protein
MNFNNSDDSPSGKLKLLGRTTLILLVLVLIGLWWINTPPGLLGKTDAVGYAVCHRITSHSFYLGDRPFSLCARCTGQYLGFLWGFGFQVFSSRKRTGFPPRIILITMGILFLFYLTDGVNSTLHRYPGLQDWSIYQPNNPLRLFSGLGMGVSLSLVLYPLLGQSIWREIRTQPALSGFGEAAALIGGGILTGFLVLSGIRQIIYPLILLSSAGLILLLTVLYGMIWIILFKRENSFKSWSELIWWAVAGLTTAWIQVIVIDLIRYQLTGTWSGFLLY